MHSIALNYTCRYCPKCDLLIVHKHDLEHLLTEMFRQYDPEAIGNEYLIIGTVEKSAWREGLHHPKAGAGMDKIQTRQGQKQRMIYCAQDHLYGMRQFV